VRPDENDVRVLGGEAVSIAYGLGNAMTFPLQSGDDRCCCHRADPGGGALILAALSVHGVLRVGRPFYASFRRALSRRPGRDVVLRCCVSAGRRFRRGRPPLCRPLRLRLLDGLGSTEMLHIFPQHQYGDVNYVTHRQACALFTTPPVDDDGPVVTPNVMGELRCVVRLAPSCLEHREQSRRLLGEVDALRRQVSSGRGATTTCMRPAATTFSSRLHLCVRPSEVEGALHSISEVLEARRVWLAGTRTRWSRPCLRVLKTPRGLRHAGPGTQEHCRRSSRHKYPRWHRIPPSTCRRPRPQVQLVPVAGRILDEVI